jgi:arsenate reductase (thioredoxin)
MAEAFLNARAGDRIEAMSAGLEPGTLNPTVVEVMKERGIDISRNLTKSAFDLYRQNVLFAYVVTVCDAEAAGRCPVFPGVTTRLHWPFPDPSRFTGTREEVIARTRAVRDQIEARVREFVEKIDKNEGFDANEIFLQIS